MSTLNMHPLLTVNAEMDMTHSPLTTAVELSLKRLPYLRDHAFQGMIILPGAAYIELALACYAQTEYLQKDSAQPLCLTDIEFHTVCLLAEEGTVSLQVDISPKGDDALQVVCHKMISSVASGVQQTRYSSLKIAPDATRIGREIVNLDAIRSLHPIEIDRQHFYTELRHNGNQYGPHFQGVAHLWRGERSAFARLIMPGEVADPFGVYHLHPVLLDAALQTLAPLGTPNGRTFVLTGIDRVEIHRFPQADCWSHACLQNPPGADAESNRGDVTLYDDAGNTLIVLTGVRFRYLDYQQEPVSPLDAEPPETIAIAATFTAEALEDPINFWRNELKIPIRAEFGPYNQIFQQLLDTNSLFTKNKRGLNVLLLRLEDWARSQGQKIEQVEVSEKEKLLAQHARHRLRNGLEIAHLNQYETDYVYNEIFVDLAYQKHGISIQDGDCIVDIGANIGLFSLWAKHQAIDTTIYAFEPSPPVFALLKTNMTLYGKDVHVFNCGISNRQKEATFTFYEKSSVFSSFDADAKEDRAAIRAVVQNMVRNKVATNGVAAEAEWEGLVDELMKDRLNSRSFTCQLYSLSDVIQENSIKQIDLLKLDAEKSELDVLNGIRQEDWPKIKQIVMEVHDREGPIIQRVTEILAAQGFEFEIEEEHFLQRSGLYNIFAVRPEERRKPHSETSQPAMDDTLQTTIREHVENLLLALRPAAEQAAVPYLVVICPPSPISLLGADRAEVLRASEDALAAALSTLNNVHVVRSTDLSALYPVPDAYNADGDRLGHIPYTQSFFAGLGTQIVRKYYTMRQAPYKVIVLDCDQTLWKGVCGEDGADGIVIDLPRRRLQEFMIEQMNAGMLLCLCSKNVEEDVWAVFDQRADMPLQRDHIVAAKINWQPKSANLQQLAQELQLGLNSFIFIDDNPVECAEVRANCPEVLTLQLPVDTPERIPDFLQHVWVFDHLKSTAEDKKRTILYQQNVKREDLRAKSLSLSDFIDSLQIEIDITEMVPANLERVSQMTQRTNQFNFTTIRRSPNEIQNLCRRGDLSCLVVHVRDRFGDYGLVGTVLYKIDGTALVIDTMLLSCRVLGRGVEHRMLAKLGEIATKHRLASVVADYIPTQKNQPALDFLNSVGLDHRSPSGQNLHYNFPAKVAQDLIYRPDVAQPETDSTNGAVRSTQSIPDRSNVAFSDPALMERIALELHNAEQIAQRIATKPLKERPQVETLFVSPTGDREQALAELWQQVLGVERVGLYDNFFEIGGTSLKGVQLISQIKNQMNIELSIVNLFECPTIHAMAALFGNPSVGTSQVAVTPNAGQSRQRGMHRRKQRLARRRARQR